MQGVLQLLQRRLYVFVGAIKGVQGPLAFFVAQHGISSLPSLLEAIQEVPASLEELPSVDEGTGWDCHRHKHARYGRVYARLQETKPQPYSQQSVGQWLAHPRQVSRHERDKERSSNGQCTPGDVGGVEEGDHHDGQYVVHYGESRHEDLEAK